MFLFALGVVMTVQANIGLAPWDAFATGVSNATGLSFGTVTILTGAVIVILVLFLREKVGLGTILNTLLIGAFADLLQAIAIIPKLENIWLGIPLLLSGLFVICIGSYFYIQPALGCGPRDSLMIAFSKRLPKVPVGVIRGAIEAMALLAGFLLGAKVGIGTVLSVFGLGFFLQIVFRMFRFAVKEVEHESIVASFQRLAPLMKKAEPAAPQEEKEA